MVVVAVQGAPHDLFLNCPLAASPALILFLFLEPFYCLLAAAPHLFVAYLRPGLAYIRFSWRGGSDRGAAESPCRTWRAYTCVHFVD